MTERSLSLRHLGDRSHGVYPPTVTGLSTARRAAGPKGFLETLFDFSVPSFVTTRIIGMPYPLILILAVLAVFVQTILAFGEPGAPLFIVIVMAFWRLFLRRERGDR